MTLRHFGIGHVLRRKLALGCSYGLLSCAFASQASAKEDGTGFEVGLRTGYAIPLGTALKTAGGNDLWLNDSIAGSVPIILDLGYRITPNIAFGAYGQYGFGILPSDSRDACNRQNRNCWLSSVRFGFEASYMLPLSQVDIWFGILAGLEQFRSSATGGGLPNVSTQTIAFPEFGVQGGAGFVITPEVSIGPFVSFSMARFSGGELSVDGESNDVDFKDDLRAFHEWLILGIRANFLP